MLEEKLIKDAIDSVIANDEMKAMDVLNAAENSGIDLIELMVHGYCAGVECVGDLFSRGEVLVNELLSSEKILKTIMIEFEKRMAVSEIKCVGIDSFFFQWSIK